MKSSDFTSKEDQTGGIGSPDAMDDPRLLAAVQEYMAAIDAGRRPNRQEFLARHCDIAADLSVCLGGLAFVNSAMGEINGKPSSSAESPDNSLMNQPLGDFRLLREIGRGGMGVVYEAQQLSLGRRVAVKVLPMAAALDPRHLQRFRNEAQAAAQLHHTNIVPVYAVGCERSVHYYAMQLIDGQSLESVVSELRTGKTHATARDDRSGSKPPPETQWPASSAKYRMPAATVDRLSAARSTAAGRTVIGANTAANLPSLHADKRATYFRVVAKLGLQAAEALFYAHQQGVVHRDIKPANLLLDAQGTLWITDFGLAQMYADTGLTQTGDVLGTFRYMSPEQASGRAVVLDQRTDIYSLGITLYELLALQRALPGQTREELMHQISSVDPKSLRSIDKKIPVELENIIGRATAKDAAERYPTARALADDLQRFLDDKPVLARRPSIVNRTIKWSRRHRAITVSGGAILAVSSIGFGVSSLLIAHEQSKTKAAYVLQLQRAVEANEQRQRAVKSFDQAREAVDFLTSMAIKELPTDPQFFQVRWRMLETSLAYYQSFMDQQRNDPSLSAQLVAAESKVSAVLAELAAVDELLRKNFEVRLLTERPVQEDLALTSAQVTSAGTLALEFGFQPPDVKPGNAQLTSEQVRQTVSEDAAAREKSLAAVLTPAQSKRLREISRQIRGAFAFSDADVVAALALTQAQKSIIRSACAEFHNHHHRGPRQMENGGERTDMTAIVAKIRASLTPHQLETLKSLLGTAYVGYSPPYEFWFSPERHHHDGPGGPGDRGEPGPGRDGDRPPQPPDDPDGPNGIGRSPNGTRPPPLGPDDGGPNSARSGPPRSHNGPPRDGPGPKEDGRGPASERPPE